MVRYRIVSHSDQLFLMCRIRLQMVVASVVTRRFRRRFLGGGVWSGMRLRFPLILDLLRTRRLGKFLRAPVSSRGEVFCRSSLVVGPFCSSEQLPGR